MDKKLKRVIGFKRNEIKIEPKHEKEQVQDIHSISIDIDAVLSEQLKKSIKITKWINSHPEFKWGVMCNKVGIDKGNFQRTLKTQEPKIKIEFISKIVDFLKNYGYAE